MVKDRFCDPAVEDDQELFNESQQELYLKNNKGQVIEILGQKRIDYFTPILAQSNLGKED